MKQGWKKTHFFYIKYNICGKPFHFLLIHSKIQLFQLFLNCFFLKTRYTNSVILRLHHLTSSVYRQKSWGKGWTWTALFYILHAPLYHLISNRRESSACLCRQRIYKAVWTYTKTSGYSYKRACIQKAVERFGQNYDFIRCKHKKTLKALW